MSPSPQQTRKEAESKVRSWGFNHVFTWTDGPNAYYRPHTHAGLTTHLILAGQLTIRYPDEQASARSERGDNDDDDDNAADNDAVDRVSGSGARKHTFGVGDRIDVPAGRRHEVWMGDEGCTYVIGE